MEYEGAVVDVDGTVVRGDDPIPGAPAAIERLRAAGVDPLFVSNNPTEAPPAYVDRLGAAGIDVTADRIVTAGTVTTEYLAAEHAADDLFVIGSAGLREQFRAAGLTLVEDHERADALVASIDHEFGYDDLCAALWTLRRDGVAFVGTDPDVVIPAPERDVPGSGAIINAVAGVAERDPDVVLGKPSEPALATILDRLGAPAERCLAIGDRLDTDIALGERAGMTTVLVRSGVTDAATLAASEHEPDYVLDSIAEIDRVLA